MKLNKRMALGAAGGALLVGIVGASLLGGGDPTPPAPPAPPTKAEEPKKDAPPPKPPEQTVAQIRSDIGKEGPEPVAAKPVDKTLDELPPVRVEAPGGISEEGLGYGCVVRQFAHLPPQHSDGEPLVHRGRPASPRGEVNRYVSRDGSLDLTSAQAGPKDAKLSFVVDGVMDCWLKIERESIYRFDAVLAVPGGWRPLPLDPGYRTPWMRQVKIEVDGVTAHEIQGKHIAGRNPVSGSVVADKFLVSAKRQVTLTPGLHKLRVTGQFTQEFVSYFPAAMFDMHQAPLFHGELNTLDLELSARPNWGADTDRVGTQNLMLRISDAASGDLQPIPTNMLRHVPADEPKPDSAPVPATADLFRWTEYALMSPFVRRKNPLNDFVSLDLESDIVGRPPVETAKRFPLIQPHPGKLLVAKFDYTPTASGNHLFGLMLDRVPRTYADRSTPSYDLTDTDGGKVTTVGACGAKLSVDNPETRVPEIVVSRFWWEEFLSSMTNNLGGRLVGWNQRKFEAGTTYHMTLKFLCEDSVRNPTLGILVKGPGDRTARYFDARDTAAPESW